jgi:hypothetical protein
MDRPFSELKEFYNDNKNSENTSTEILLLDWKKRYEKFKKEQ